jgi:hypothetical protein
MGEFARQQAQTFLPADHPINHLMRSGLDVYSEDMEVERPVTSSRRSSSRLNPPLAQRGEWSDVPKEYVYEREQPPTRYGDAPRQHNHYQQSDLDGFLQSGSKSTTERATGPLPSSSYDILDPNRERSFYQDPYAPPPPSSGNPTSETGTNIAESRLSAAESNRRARLLARQRSNRSEE